MAYGNALGLARSIEFLVKIGTDNIFKYNLLLADMLVEGLRKRNANITSPLSEKYRSPIVTATFYGLDPSSVIKDLKEAGVYLSKRGDALRFSPHLYNDPDHIQGSLDHIDRICLK
jgi:selenocysteine lyase/cysteine desulfurase